MATEVATAVTLTDHADERHPSSADERVAKQRIPKRLDIRWTREDAVPEQGPVEPEAFAPRIDVLEAEQVKVYQCKSMPVRYDIYDYYDVGETLGEGCSGIVKHAICKKTGKEWAVKMIDLMKEELQTDFVVQSIRNEIQIMKFVDHPSCVQLYEVIEQSWQRTHIMFLTLELLAGGDLFDRINEEPLSERDVACLAADVLSGVAYLHSRGIVHRDIKPENLLFASSDPDSRDYKKIKISDFGLAAVLNPKVPLRDMCGTPGYVAPEVINPTLTGDIEVDGVLMKAGYECPVDVWSTGVLIYECICGSTPFCHEEVGVMLQLTMRGEFAFEGIIWERVSDGAKDLISRMLVMDPYSRKPAVELLEHPWIKDHDDVSDVELHESRDLLLDKRPSRTQSSWNVFMEEDGFFRRRSCHKEGREVEGWRR